MSGLARAGQPMTDREIWCTLRAMAAPERVTILVTDGPARLGRTIVQVSGTDDALGVLDLVAARAGSHLTLHAIRGDEVVSVTGTANLERDRGAITVRRLLWSCAGLGALVAAWSLWAADLVDRMQALGVTR